MVVGDVHPRVADVAGALTPVPGGVGPLTIAMLLKNTVAAAVARQRERISDGTGQGKRETMLQAALTGGIATGKSYCLGQVRGARDSDDRRRSAGAPGRRARFAGLDGGGRAVRPVRAARRRHARSAALGRIIFADRAARADLEAIVHPDVYRRIREWFARLPPATPVAIADIPLLFETGHQHDFDRVIVCACAPAEQLRRLVARDGLSEPDARARLARAVAD